MRDHEKEYKAILIKLKKYLKLSRLSEDSGYGRTRLANRLALNYLIDDGERIFQTCFETLMYIKHQAEKMDSEMFLYKYGQYFNLSKISVTIGLNYHYMTDHKSKYGSYDKIAAKALVTVIIRILEEGEELKNEQGKNI